MIIYVNNIEQAKNGSDNFILELKIGESVQEYKIKIDVDSDIKSIQYGAELEKLIWSNLSDAKKLNNLIWTIVRGEKVEYPYLIGDF